MAMQGRGWKNALHLNIQKQMNTNQPIFETYADLSFGRVRATYAQRGTEYGDSWRNCQWLAMRATCRKLGIEIPEKLLRALAVAALYDVKYQRLEGGYKDDSVIDAMAYGGLWAEEMRRLAEQSTEKVYIAKEFTGGPGMAANGLAKATPELGASLNGRSHQ
jgi:hypothetical protein